MGVTTVTVFKVDRGQGPFRSLDVLPGGGAFTFQYQLRPGVSSNPCRGICWDGMSLCFSTEGQNILQGPGIVRVDPSTGAVIQIVTPAAVVGGLDAIWADICYDGHSYYVIRQDPVAGNGIDQLSREGTFIRTVFNGLGNGEACIDFNGKHLLTVDLPTGNVNSYDPSTGILERSAPGIAEVFGGIVADRSYRIGEFQGFHQGHHYGYTVKSSDQFVGGFIFYRVYDPTAVGTFGNRTGTRAITTEGDQLPLTWDGSFLWEFSQVTA